MRIITYVWSVCLLTGLGTHAATVQENTTFPMTNIIGDHYLESTGNDANTLVRNELSKGNDLKTLVGQSFTLSSSADLAAITVQQGIAKNWSKSGASPMTLWIGEYDTTDVSNHVVGATYISETFPMTNSFTGGNFYTFNLDTPTNLPAGDYAFELFWTDQSGQAVHRTWFNYSTTGGYADGQLISTPFTSNDVPPIGETSGEDVFDLVFGLHSAPVLPPPAELLTPADLAMVHSVGANATTGTVDAIHTSSTDMDVTITISDESHSGAFTVLSATPQTLTNETTELAFKFDNTVASLAGGETATGVVTFAWAETDGGASGTNYMSISALATYPEGELNTFKGYVNTAWGASTNWDLGRVPGTLAADRAQVKSPSVVDLTTNFTGAVVWETLVRGDGGGILNIGADFLNAGDMTLGGVSGHYGFVNQTQGSVELKALNIGHSSGVSPSNSVYALSGGILTSSANGTIYTNGQMVINGGSLIYDTTGDNDMFIIGDGILKLESGTWSSTGSAGGDVLTFNANVEISGGTVDLTGRNHFSREFKIIGDAASISVQRINIAPDFVFEFAPGGGSALSAVDVPTYLRLTNTTIVVDGSSYNGGSTEIPLFTTVNVDNIPADPATAFITTNFADGVTAIITADTVENTVILSITAVGYESWIQDFGLTGDDALPGTDVEPDGLDNLMEYALGGNPTIDDAALVSPKTYTADDGGTDYFYHVSDQRADDASLTFTLGTETELPGTPTWDTNDVSFVGESMGTNNYKTVTNRTVATPDAKFIQLEVQKD